jgi:hypothetical protein
MQPIAPSRDERAAAGLIRTSFEFTTSVDAAVDARRLLGRGGNRIDLVIDVAAIVAGLVLVALGQLLLGAVLVVLASAFLVLSAPLQRAAMSRQARSMLGRRTRVTIDDTAVRMSGDLGSVEIPWSSVTDVRASDRTVILVRDRLLVGYVPSSAFDSPAEQAAFVRFAAQRVADTGSTR